MVIFKDTTFWEEFQLLFKSFPKTKSNYSRKIINKKVVNHIQLPSIRDKKTNLLNKFPTEQNHCQTMVGRATRSISHNKLQRKRRLTFWTNSWTYFQETTIFRKALFSGNHYFRHKKHNMLTIFQIYKKNCKKHNKTRW